MIFDRILRFAITGNRVRNYDGLGGQLLFGYLHQNDVVRWTDTRLIVDWERVGDAVAGLRERIEVLYREGIDLSRVSYWVGRTTWSPSSCAPTSAPAGRRRGARSPTRATRAPGSSACSTTSSR